MATCMARLTMYLTQPDYEPNAEHAPMSHDVSGTQLCNLDCPSCCTPQTGTKHRDTAPGHKCHGMLNPATSRAAKRLQYTKQLQYTSFLCFDKNSLNGLEPHAMRPRLAA